MQEIDVNLQPSRWLLIVLLLVLILTEMVIFLIAGSIYLKIVLTLVALIYSGFIAQRNILLRHPESIVKITIKKEGSSMATRSQTFAITLKGESTITQWISILRFYSTEMRKNYSCLVLRDNLSKDQYRRLLVILRGVAR
jgi:hypothetical protein